MKILAVGDIVGEAGVRKLKEELPKIKKEENIYNFYYEKVPKTGLNFIFN